MDPNISDYKSAYPGNSYYNDRNDRNGKNVGRSGFENQDTVYDHDNVSPSNMEWDSTYEEKDSRDGFENDKLRTEDYGKGRDYDYGRDDYYGEVEERRLKDRSRDSRRERSREIERELERARYSDRHDRDGDSWDQGRSRDREQRDRSWDREKDRTRDRDRGRDRERDRDRERGRNRDPYRDRDRDRDRRRDDRTERDKDNRQRDRDYDDRYSRDRRRGSADGERNNEKEKAPPSAHIMIRGSPSALKNEDEIGIELQQHGLEYQDIKIVRNRHGESRGFGFVDFYDVATAEKWMNLTKGTLMIGDQRFSLEYSKTRAPPSTFHQIDVDWYCSKCRTLNYASRKRVTCFSCGEYRKDYPPDGNDDYDYDDHGHMKDSPMSAPPCNVLMMRGLDTNTTEETIRTHLLELTSVPIYDVRLIKDKVTGISRGFCFIELGSTEDATALLEKIQESDPAYFIEGRRVSVGYARNTPHPPPSKFKQGGQPGSGQSQAAKNVNLASVAIAQAQAAQLQGQSTEYNYQSPQPQQYAQAVTGSQKATDVSQQQHASQSANFEQQATTDAAQQQQAQQYYQQQQNQLQQLQQQQAQRQHAYANYTYDPTTGYYYDSSTGLYYDANTGYYYNGTTGRFLHWDAQQQQYYIVNQDGSLSAMDSEGNPIPTSAAPAEKVKAKPTGSNARKIAKDMERWAKKMNEAKVAKSNAAKQAQIMLKEQEAREEAIRKQIQNEILLQNAATTAQPKTDAIKITSKALFGSEDDDNSQSLAALIAAKTDSKGLSSSLVAEYGDDSDDDQTDKLIDWNKLMCLLCKRQFPNKDILTKHQQMSDLHKQNLEKYKQKLRS